VLHSVAHSGAPLFSCLRVPIDRNFPLPHRRGRLYNYSSAGQFLPFVAQSPRLRTSPADGDQEAKHRADFRVDAWGLPEHNPAIIFHRKPRGDSRQLESRGAEL